MFWLVYEPEYLEHRDAGRDMARGFYLQSLQLEEKARSSEEETLAWREKAISWEAMALVAEESARRLRNIFGVLALHLVMGAILYL